MKPDNRAIASGFIGFILVLVIGAIIFVFLQEPMQNVFSMGSSQATTQEAQDAISMREQIWSNILWFVVFLGGVGLIARAVVESRRGGV